MTPETAITVQQAAPVINGLLILLGVVGVREMIRKGIALWKAGTKKQKAWFVCIFIFNTAGILPILYLAFRQKKGK